MVTKEQIDNYHQKKRELHREYSRLKVDIFNQVVNLLQWKNDNLGMYYNINYIKTCGYISDLFEDRLYCGNEVVFYDQLFSDDWKPKALEAYAQRKQKIEAKAEKKRKKQEEKERAEYERLKAKFERGE